MSTRQNLVSAKTSALLLATGLAVATLAGCASSGSSAPASSAAASTAGPTATASAQPSWAASLGTGVTVVAPQSVSPGHSSPQAVVKGLLTALGSKQVAAFCGYALPSAQAHCKSGMTQMPSSQFPYAKNAAIGYAVIDGNKAAVGMTGTFCTPGNSPECFTNSDPAAVFSTVHSFSGLWKNANLNSTTSYVLTPCEKIGEEWYLGSSS
jgi:hypothetical protein